jgi:hypothetical protein
MNEIEKEFVPYQIALDMKSIGFDEPCLGRYWHEEFKLINIDKQFEVPHYACSAPTYSQAFRFLRENRHLKFFIKEDDFRESVYEYGIKEVINITGFKTYEQAELECLKKLIQIVNEKKIHR